MYIAIEGIDGIGKTTLIEGLKASPLANDAIFIQEPFNKETKTEGENALEYWFKTKKYLFDVVEKYAKDRQALKKIFSDFENSDKSFLISDRSFYSSLAYQITMGYTEEYIHEKNQGLPKPYVVILLTSFRKQPFFLKQVQTEYLKQMKKLPVKKKYYITVDFKSIDGILEEVVNFLTFKKTFCYKKENK